MHLALLVADDLLEKLTDHLVDLLPALTVLALLVVCLPLAHRSLLGERSKVGTEQRLPRQLALLGVTLFGLVLLVIALPLETETRGQVLSLAGIAFTAVLTLSSTTFVGNAMAGLMLRSIRSFRPGDYIRVDGSFGRVTERGLFHVEIQTVDRDLTTLPNTFLITHPVKVVRADGTIVSETVSLGYDVSRQRVEALLLQAAERTGLVEPFVQVTELGDYSVALSALAKVDCAPGTEAGRLEILALERSGDAAAAKAKIEAFLAVDPDDVVVTSARERLDAPPPTLDQRADDPFFTVERAERYVAIGRVDRAIRVYRRILASHPGHHGITQRLRQLAADSGIGSVDDLSDELTDPGLVPPEFKMPAPDLGARADEDDDTSEVEAAPPRPATVPPSAAPRPAGAGAGGKRRRRRSLIRR